MGKSQVLNHQDVMYVIKKLLLTGFVLGLVACAAGHQTSLEQQKQQTDEAEVASPLDVTTGAVYTRWGRTVCPSGATLVYRGVMGGENSGTEGGGNQFLCLTDKPEWGEDGTTGDVEIYGTEYMAGEELFSKENAEKLINHDAVCAVCSSARSVQVMIPGRQSCMEGWTREYYGYLMTSFSYVASKNYVCIDNAPEADKAGYKKEGGAFLGPVKAKCGSLPCPGYVNAKELTCVVCSR